MNDIKKEDIRQAMDIAESLDKQLTNLIGLLEFVYLGMESLYHGNESYELSSISIIRSYLAVLRQNDTQKLLRVLRELENLIK